MIPLKFRAWDKETQRMYPVKVIDCSRENDPMAYVYIITHNKLVEERVICRAWDNIKKWHTPIMQYTGRKDKNEVEIYAGDILDIADKRRRGKKGETSHLMTFKEEGTEDDWGNFYTAIGFIFPCNMEDHEWEIIGNIYENPELYKPFL